MLRIIAGQWRGRRLHTPRQGTRPTSDRVREALFSILGPQLDGLRVLDLFAGSGALGLEALSRGSGQVTFVERDRAALRVIERNIASLDAAARCRVCCVDVRRFLATSTAEHHELVFADPPYAQLPEAALWQRLRRGHLAADGRLVVEHSARLAVSLGAGYGEVCTRRYGDTAITLARATGSGQHGDQP